MTDIPRPEELAAIDAYWRAANYLSVGQIYLLDNPLLRQPLTLEHIKPRLLGHWGTVPGLNFIYAHLNRVIRRHDLEMIYVTGPKLVDGLKADGTWRSQQVPIADMASRPEHLILLEQCMQSYRPQELFNETGRLLPALAALAPVPAPSAVAHRWVHGGPRGRARRRNAYSAGYGARRFACPVPFNKPGSQNRCCSGILVRFHGETFEAGGLSQNSHTSLFPREQSIETLHLERDDFRFVHIQR